MKEVDANWAEYIRKAIKAKIVEVERRKAAEELDAIRARAKQVARVVDQGG